MRFPIFALAAVAALALPVTSAIAAAAQGASQFQLSGKAAETLKDHVSINADTARKVAEAAEAIAKKNNSQMVVVILNAQGLVIHQHAMDGEGYVSIHATEHKALTALRTRQPTKLLMNRQLREPFTETHMMQYDLTVQEGGLPIIVDGQVIGAIGCGGIPGNQRTPTYDEDLCARDALAAVFGPQPPMPPDVPKNEISAIQ